ncbi:B2 protein-like [Cryptotermes secundus]|uniref:B2 protein-like n=1 Tax=Cryptotermes secundus TaxID=105785 RepID=UPI000CD7DB1F|nr:B2 protein-like [Cryptotermes secundus]
MLLFPTAIFIFCVAAASGDSRFDSLDEDQKSMLRMLRDTCLGESGADESLIKKAVKGDFAEDEKLKVYMACTFQQIGAMDDAGVPDMDTMVSMLPESMQERGGKMIEACKTVSGSGAPDTAMKLNQCFYKSDPEFFFII